MKNWLRGLIGLSLFSVTLALQPATAATLSDSVWGKNPDQPWGTKRAITQADKMAIASYRSGHHGSPVYSTNFTDPAQLSSQWLLQSDDSWSLKSCRRPNNIVATASGLRIKTLLSSDCHQHAPWSTGSMWSKTRYKYGFFEATMKIADINGFNNAFWLTTDDNFEIDISEIHYPNAVSTVLHNWTGGHDHSVGFKNIFADNLPAAFHDYGVLWTPTDLIYEVDGEPVAAIATNGSINGTADIRFSTALAAFAGTVPDHPEGHDMLVKSLRVFPLSR